MLDTAINLAVYSIVISVLVILLRRTRQKKLHTCRARIWTQVILSSKVSADSQKKVLHKSYKVKPHH